MVARARDNRCIQDKVNAISDATVAEEEYLQSLFWLQEAELLRVDSRVVGQFSTAVRTENFVMNTR